MNPLISVIITSFNRSEYLKIAIESVLDSTFSDFELIISDDRSFDDSYKIACEYAVNDSRIKVFINEVNVGDYPNRMLSIDRANGKWIKFVDCDDYISKDCLQIMYDYAKGQNLCFGICAPGFTECRRMNQLEAFESGVLSYFGPTGSFFLKDKYIEYGGFVNRITVSDWHLWERFALKGDIMVFPERLATWRDHINNTLKSDSHNYGVIKYFLLSKHEILSNPNHPFDLRRRNELFRNAIVGIFKLTVRFSLRTKSLKPLIMLLRYNIVFLLNSRHIK